MAVGVGIDQVGTLRDAITVGVERFRRSGEFGGAETSPSVAGGGDGGRLDEG